MSDLAEDIERLRQFRAPLGGRTVPDMRPEHWQSWLLNIEEVAAKESAKLSTKGSAMTDAEVTRFHYWGLLLTYARHLREAFGTERLLAAVEAEA